VAARIEHSNAHRSNLSLQGLWILSPTSRTQAQAIPDLMRSTHKKPLSMRIQ